MRVLFVLFMMCVYSFLWSQDIEKKVIIKKSGDQKENVWTSDDGEKHVIEKTKTVTVDVSQEGDNERKVKIVTIQDGEQQVMEWVDQGTIPTEVREKLDKDGIDIQMIDPSSDIEQEIEITIDDRDEIIEIEWDGEGEMPEDLKRLREDHDIDIQEYLGGEDGERKVFMIKKDKGSKGPHKAHKRIITDQKYKMITIDDDGNKSVIEWIGDGDMPNELMEHMGEEDIVFHQKRGLHRDRDHGAKRMMIFSDDEDDMIFMDKEPKLSNAYMGAQIESVEKGVEVLDLMKDSPADKAKLKKGDIIQKINGARTRDMDSLLDLLNYFEPNDKVEVTVLRDGKEKKLSMTLSERPDHFR
jgi:hypothetical protein